MACSCCGNEFPAGDLTSLMCHPEVALCGECIGWLNRQRGQVGSATVRTAIPVLISRDVPAALGRYERLGFSTELYGDGDYGFLERDGVELHIGKVEELDPLKQQVACYLFVADTDALIAEWQAADVEGRITDPFDTDYGLREAAYIDPDGNLVRVGSPLPS